MRGEDSGFRGLPGRPRIFARVNLPSQVYHLLRAELRREWRDKYALGSVLLYVVATTTIVYLGLTRLSTMTFNAMFWVVLFFGATVAAGRSFLREGGRRHYYYYTLAGPEALLLAKLIYNTLVIWVIGLVAWGLLSFFAEVNLISNVGYWVCALLLAGVGLSAVLTFVAAVAARAGGNATLMAVLSLPLLVPLLYLLVNAGARATRDVVGQETELLTYVAAVDLLGVAAGLVLFPFVWRD